MLKKIIHLAKGKLMRNLNRDRDAVIIAGLGRCGTTLVYDSFKINHYYIPQENFLMFSENHTDFKFNTVYKTHDYPPESLPNNVKLIFMFGNPMNTVISAHRKINEWGKLHHKHLGTDLFRTNDNIFTADTLKLNELFEAWYQKQNFPFLSVRYETLYRKDTVKAISEYLGFRFKLLPQRSRKTNWETHPLKGQLLSIYGGLNKKILDCHDFKKWGKSSIKN